MGRALPPGREVEKAYARTVSTDRTRRGKRWGTAGARLDLTRDRSGSDREAEKRAEAERRANNFEAVARDFVQRYAKPAQPRSWRETARTFERHLFPRWGERPFTSIRRKDLHEILDALDAAKKPGAKHHVVAAVTKLFNWAVDREIIEASPFARMQRPKIGKRERILADEEIVTLWQACEAQSGIFARFVQLLLLTGARRNEIARLRWPEVDEVGRMIVLSSDRTKSGRIHVIPLSPLAAEVLASLPRFADREYVFEARRAEDKPIAGFSKLKKRLDDSMDEPIDYDLHDLRRTFRTGLSRLRIPNHVSERCLGHAQSGLEETYDRWSYIAEKREAVEAWADFVQRLVSPAANVDTLQPIRHGCTGQ